MVCEDKDNKLLKSNGIICCGGIIYFTHLQHLYEQLRTQKSKMSNTSLKGNTKKLPYAATSRFSVSIQLSIQQKYQQIFSQISLKWEEIDILPPITVKYSSFKKDFGCQVMSVYLTPISCIRHIDFHTSGKPTYVYFWIMLI